MSGAESKGVDGRQLRWQQHKRERRQSVIDATLEVLQSREPGDEIHVKDITDHAGLNRSVVHRHFADRSDLDLAVQREICSRAAEVVFAAVTLEGTPREVVHRVVDAYIRWAVAHRAWARFAERDVAGTGPKPLDEALQDVAQRLEMIIGAVATIFGGQELTKDDRDWLEPWVFGLVGGGLDAVQRWTSRDELRPPLETFADLLTDVVWFQIDGLAQQRGIPLPDIPVEDYIATVLGSQSS